MALVKWAPMKASRESISRFICAITTVNWCNRKPEKSYFLTSEDDIIIHKLFRNSPSILGNTYVIYSTSTGLYLKCLLYADRTILWVMDTSHVFQKLDYMETTPGPNVDDKSSRKLHCEFTANNTENMEGIRRFCEIYLVIPIAVIGIIGNLLSLIVLCGREQRRREENRASTTIIGEYKQH